MKEQADEIQARMEHHINAIDYIQCLTGDMSLEGMLSQITESMEKTKSMVAALAGHGVIQD